VEISPTVILSLKEEHSKLKQVHERVSKENNPHTTSKCISTDIRGLNAESSSKNSKQFFQVFPTSGFNKGSNSRRILTFEWTF
jgi:hypothetical protein